MNAGKRLTCERDVRKRLFPYLTLFAILLIWHLGLPVNTGDDIYFMNALEQSSALAFLMFRYMQWSSRLLIECVLIFVVRAPYVWRILDSLALTLIAVMTSAMFNEKKSPAIDWGSCVVVMLFPLLSLNEAGYVATTVNYIWPFAAGMLAMKVFQKAWKGERISLTQWLCSWLCLIFACNMELTCAMLLGIEGVLLAYRLITDRKNRSGATYMVGSVVIAVAGCAFIFSCPGNALRYTLETQNWFPEYPELSYLTRLEIGFAATGYQLVMRTNWLFILFAVLLYLASKANKNKNVWACWIPLGLSLVMGPFSGVLKGFSGQLSFSKLLSLEDRLTKTGTLPYPVTWMSIMPDLLLLLSFLCIVYHGLQVFSNRNKSRLMLLIIVTGLMSNVVLGFSPTIWASGVRISYFANLAFGIASVILLTELEETLAQKHYDLLNKGMIAALVLSAFNCVVC